MKYLCLLLLFTSCSQLQTLRTPASSVELKSNSCLKTTSDLIAKTHDYHPLFRRVFKDNKGVDYWINFDRVKKTITELPEKFPNQIDLRILGEYDGEPIYRIDIPGWGSGEKRNILISAGVHGNESAGVATALNFIQNNMHNAQIRNNFNIVIIPYLNPGGLKNNLRRLNNNIDLNRTFKPEYEQGPTRMVQESLRGESFVVALDLHEAPNRNKFFVIKSAKDDHLITRNVLETVNKDYLYTSDSYPGHMPNATNPKKNSYLLYGPGEAQSSNLGTVKGFYSQELGVKYSYTLEAPGKFNLNKKIDVYTDIVEKYIYEILKRAE